MNGVRCQEISVAGSNPVVAAEQRAVTGSDAEGLNPSSAIGSSVAQLNRAPEATGDAGLNPAGRLRSVEGNRAWKAGDRVKHLQRGWIGTVKSAPWHLLVEWDVPPDPLPKGTQYLVNKNEVELLSDDQETLGK